MYNSTPTFACYRLHVVYLPASLPVKNFDCNFAFELVDRKSPKAVDHSELVNSQHSNFIRTRRNKYKSYHKKNCNFFLHNLLRSRRQRET